MMPPVIVEFTGLSGVGKTTITKALISKLTAAGYNCFPPHAWGNPETVNQKGFRQLFSKLKVLHYLILCLVRHNRVALNALRYAFQVTPFNLAGARRILMLVTRLELISTLINDNYDLLVFDEGLIQNIWSMVITGNPPSSKYLMRLLKSLLDEITLAIILVDVDIDVAVKRIEERATMHSRFDRMSSNKAEKLLFKHKEYFESIIHCTVALNRADCLNVKGSLPVEENVDAIVHFIDHLQRV